MKKTRFTEAHMVTILREADLSRAQGPPDERRTGLSAVAPGGQGSLRGVRSRIERRRLMRSRPN